jgi:hypothetical protein
MNGVALCDGYRRRMFSDQLVDQVDVVDVFLTNA